ncbi:hypothetical protein OIE66_35590 [Nonomuraea sp. NBC_01738]|uniref:PseG/SpsG family protein n=1 Tax=Nonomuraea sp. NBC_01738 TaxID=2976003 RepID=UPI002E0D5A0F|nr:hypothetical protein OIE66_35590 [Nonomuraea sp. NBC_01738]
MTRVGIRCDAGPAIGVGHLIRCLSLAEELTGRGAHVEIIGDLGGLAWAEQEVAARALAVTPCPGSPDGLADLAGRRGLTHMVLDSYTLDSRCAARLRERGVRVLAIVDGDRRGQDADLFLDQNLGAESAQVAQLAGLRYALLRDVVRQALPMAASPEGDVPRVLCFFGGTDAGAVAPVITRLLVRTGVPFEATVITTAPGSLEVDRACPGQAFTVIPPTTRLPYLIGAADLVVTAAGSAMWEVLYLGRAAALVWVAGNQVPGYREMVRRGLAAGLGQVRELDDPEPLRTLLTSADTRRRLRAGGAGLVDGKGRERVADALLAL